MSKDVYIVHCIDTEGPLYESLEATFQRVKEIFDIDIEPTKENLIKLQNKNLECNGQEELIADAFSEKRIRTLGTWDQIDAMLDEVLSDSFRNCTVDSDGNGWIYNWFCLDHVGFWGNNPRRRDVGYGNVYNHYYNLLKRKNQLGRDMLQFHYHALPFNGAYNYAGTAYVNSSNLFTILARKIIDNHFFPSVYRAGMEAERPDAHWFLEQWIPFDFSCNSYIKDNNMRQPDLRNGRYGDWRRATLHWHPYHPSYEDYQTDGKCKRWISRCLSVDSRLIGLSLSDVRQAFEESEEDHPTILAFSSHDFRNLKDEVTSCINMIKEAAKCYQTTKFYYATALEAMRRAEKIPYSKSDLNAKIEIKSSVAELRVWVNELSFGVQPFLAIKTTTEQYFWDNFDFAENKTEWTYTFDDKTLNIKSVDTIGIAINSAFGVTEIIILNVQENYKEKIVLNDIHS